MNLKYVLFITIKVPIASKIGMIDWFDTGVRQTACDTSSVKSRDLLKKWTSRGGNEKKNDLDSSASPI